MTFEVNDMKTLLDSGLGKIDKTALSAGTKVDMIESLASLNLSVIMDIIQFV